MTIFGCDTCSCDCPAPCAFTTADCFEISFSGFASNAEQGYSCFPCDSLNDQTIIVKRSPPETLGAIAYAIRQEPNTGGDEAAFEVTLTRDPKTNFYSVSGISVVDGGSGYAGGTRIEFAYGYVYDGVFRGGSGASVRCDRTPFAWITGFSRSQPAINAAVGCGESLSVTLAESADAEGEPVWVIDSVQVESGGYGCQDGATVTFTPQSGITAESAQGVAITGREEPALYVQYNGEFLPAFVSTAETQDDQGNRIWIVDSIEFFGTPDPPEPQLGDSLTIIAFADTTIVSSASAVISSVSPFAATVTSPGAYYDSNGIIESIQVTEPGAFYRPGSISAVTVVDGGEVYDVQTTACQFRGKVCSPCPTDFGQEINGLITFASDGSGGSSASVQVSFGQILGGGTKTLTATASGIQPDAVAIEFSEFTSQSLCQSAGTVTVTAVDCDVAPQSPCAEMPQQIEVTFSGLAAGALLQNVPPDNYPPLQAAANAECGMNVNAQCFVNSSSFSEQLAYSVGDDAAVVFDLVSSSCAEYTYSATAPAWQNNAGNSLIRCDFPAVSEIRIRKLPCAVTVEASRTSEPSPENYLCPPGDTCPGGGGGIAAADLAVSGTKNGAITSIAVLSPGNCYAWRTFDYVEPEATAYATTPLGSGAEFTIEWEQYENQYGNPEFRVLAVQGSGGTGYIDGDEVLIETSEGTCGDGFRGSIITKRVEPLPELTLPSPGSGAEISYTLAEIAPTCLRQYGVEAISVSAVGDGYKDGDQVSISVTSGSEIEPASAVVVVLRTAPTITASIGDATLDVTLAESVDFSGKPVWGVSAVTVVSGGSGGVANGAAVTFAVTADVEFQPPFATAQVDQAGVVTAISVIIPGQVYNDTGPVDSVNVTNDGYYCGTESTLPPVLQLTISSQGGSGAELTTSTPVRRILPCYKTWEFDTVAVVQGGDGYRDRSEIDITLNDGVVVFPATLLVRVNRSEPVVTASVGNATLSVSLSQATDFFGDAVWTVASISVIDGGFGIAQNSTVGFSLASGSVNAAPQAYVNVDGNGTVTSVVLTFGGQMVNDIGPIASVQIAQAGEYWNADSSVGCVNIDTAGAYYKAVPAGVEVSPPDIDLLTFCGTGATADAVIDVDPESPTFGGITSVTVTNGGQDYFPLGDAWVLTASIASVSSQFTSLWHMTKERELFPFGQPIYPDPPADGDPDFTGPNWIGNDFQHNAYEPLANRVSLLCAADLLAREYRMFWLYTLGGPVTDAGGNECGKFFRKKQFSFGFPVYLETFVRRFAGQDIKVSIRPLPAE